MSEQAVLDTPFRGLMPYSEEDAAFFFGRQRDQEIVTANLMAARLTLLYGPSGVGKSSVLRAGVAHHLRERARSNLARRGTPRFVVVVFSSWRDDPLAGLLTRIRDSVALIMDTPPEAPPAPRSLVEAIAGWEERLGAKLLIVLDQFEEYFLYHAREDGEGTFAAEFPRAVNSLNVRAGFVLSLREDWVAKLDRFKGQIPNLFDNYLRMDHLDREAAREAIEKPVHEYRRRLGPNGPPVSLGEGFSDEVLDDLEQLADRGVLARGGGGVARENGSLRTGARIQTPYLQLVMKRLWNEAVRGPSHELRPGMLTALGGALPVVQSHLDGVMGQLGPDDQRAAAAVFYHLVTPGGTKIAQRVSDLSEYVKLPAERLVPMLEALADKQACILSRVGSAESSEPRYEIFHDLLGGAILNWRARHVRTQEQAEAEQRLARERAEADERLAQERAQAERRLALAELAHERQRMKRMRWAAGLLSTVLVVVAALASFAMIQRNDAVTQHALAEEARAQAVAQHKLAEEAHANAVAQRELAEQAHESARRAQAEAHEQQVQRARAEMEAQQQIAVLAAVQLANNAEIQAMLLVDPAPLHEYYVGQALQERLEALAELEENGLFVVSRLHDVQPRSFSVSSDGLRAEVQRIETWTVAYYAAEHSGADWQCVGRVPKHEVPQTISLELRDMKWMISSVQFEGPSPEPVACREFPALHS